MKPHQFVIFATALCVSGAGIGGVASVSSSEITRAPMTDVSAQTRERPRVRVTPPAAYDYPRPGPYAWPGPGYVRQCVDWYATEYRVSGTVVTPQMRCRWVRG